MSSKWRSAALCAASTLAFSVAVVGVSAPAGAVPVALPSLVDDGVYPYPDAAQILAEQNVRLISGDGHIVLADCATPPVGNIGLLKVWTTDELIGPDGVGRVCFKVNAPSGVLNLEVPGVYEIRGDGQTTGTGHEVTAELEDETGEEITVEIDPDGSTPVGLGADPTAPPTMLLQLRAGDGPAPVTGTQAAVGKLTGPDRMCTTTLVAPRWVLTAASCLATDPNQPQVTEGAPVGVHHVVFPGHAAVAVDWLSPRAGRDVVLARLATAIQDITPVALATTAPTGVALTATGYGRNTDWITDQQQTAQITFTNTTATTLTTTSGPLVCSGMAGAPVLTDGKLAAILTQAGQAGCLGVTATDTSVTATRTDDLTTWSNAITTTTAAHTWTLADTPAAATPGTAVTTTTDTVFTGTALPLTATAGTTWNTGDQFSPNIALNGTTGTLTTGAPAVTTGEDFTVSVWAKATVAGTVLSQDGVNTAGFRLWADPSDNSWRFAMTRSDVAVPVWDTAAAPAASFAPGVWTHLTATFKKADNKVYLRVGDADVAFAPHSTSWNAGGALRIGAYRTGAATVGGYFGGQVAFVQTWNQAVVTPKFAPPPRGTSYLSDTNWLWAANGFGPVEKNSSVGEDAAGDGNPQTINGTHYYKGLGMHAPAEVYYYLGGGCMSVSAYVGVDDEETAAGSVVFQIWKDSTKVADSGTKTFSQAASLLTADVSGATMLRLVVTDAGNGVTSDHADWANLKITCGGVEAESGTLVGAAVVTACPTCSGGNKVGFIGNGANQVTLTVDLPSPAYRLTVSYVVNGTRSFYIGINGGVPQLVTLTGTSWTDPVDSAPIQVKLGPGVHTVRFFNDTAFAPDLDKIIVY
ncbi:NPCBM/NEW2 domain-containing protein [Catellatospora sichuanensis]|uniref:NPCBM/NEW2 domain-containing protein n=1 Tax=Catellatospora sichuanensis TaxID=1969805 RepID=UPI001C9215D2|nr:NPCBM/NEW2 domain-containing protein [Catellatospora sichuanensis]